MKIKEVSTFKPGSVDLNIWKWQKSIDSFVYEYISMTQKKLES